MMKPERTLLREVAFAYVRNYERMEQAVARGDEELRDRHFANIELIENGVKIIELNGGWR